MLLSLDDVKLHCRITDDSEDPIIRAYIESAEQFVSDYTGRTFTAENLPALAKVVILMVVANLFENRESTIVGNRITVVENSLCERYLSMLRENLSV